MDRALTLNRDAIEALCHKHHAACLDAFGCAAVDRLPPDTHFAFIVTFSDDLPPGRLASSFYALRHGLEEVLGTEVDLILESSVHNPHFRDRIQATRQPFCNTE